MPFKKTTWSNIPEWALYALEYGTNENQSLTDEDKNQIETFISHNFPKGYYMSVNWENYDEFNISPAFGKACGTYEVTFCTEE